MRRKAKSTVGHHLRVLGNPGEHANQLQRYLAGPLTEVQRFKFVCRAGVLLTARRRFQQGQAQTARCPFCPERLEETMHHALLACSAFDAERAAMWAAVEKVVGWPAVSAAQALPAEQQLSALLGDSFWGDRAQAVDGAVQQYLAGHMRRRRAAVLLRWVVRPAIWPVWRARRATSAAVRPLCCCAIAATGGTTLLGIQHPKLAKGYRG
jgi:hypothetical protein